MANRKKRTPQEQAGFGLIRVGVLRDPRIERTKKHVLSDLVTIALGAVLCGADGWIAVEQWGLGKEKWLRTFLDLPHGIPSHDTFSRVFARLDPQEFSSCLLEWTAQLAEGAKTHKGVIAIDGKTLRRTFRDADRKTSLHLLTAWASDARVVLAQQKVDDKSNEITGIPELLKKLDIRGCIVTIDAMGCQKTIVAQVTQRGADYVIGLKDNQPSLREYAEQHIDLSEQRGFSNVRGEPLLHTTHRAVDGDHGRIETRTVTALSVGKRFVQQFEGWESIQSVVRVQRVSETKEKTTDETSYYIASLGAGHAELLQSVIRAHWSVENDLHWTLDVQMNEDRCRIHKDHGPENFAALNRTALSLLRQNKTVKVGAKSKQLRAATDNDYLLKLLQL